MRNSDLYVRSFDLIRFPLIVTVVIIHTFSFDDGTASVYMPPMAGMQRFIDGFLGWQAIPIFFFISGFMFFYGCKDLTVEKYGRKLKNRVRTLLVPYVLWNAVAVMLLLVKRLPCFYALFPNVGDVSLDLSIPAMLSTFWDASGGIFVYPDVVNYNVYPQNAPLWYVRDLMVIVLIVPLIYWLLKRMRYYVVLGAGILWFILGNACVVYLDQFMTAFFFFTWGAYISINNTDLIKGLKRFDKIIVMLYPLLALLFILSEIYFPIGSYVVKRVNMMIGLLFAVVVSVFLLKHNVCRINRFLVSSCFIIYVMHPLVCDNVVKVFLRIFAPSTGSGVLSVYLLSVLVTVGGLLVVYSLLKQYAPSMLKIVVGRV